MKYEAQIYDSKEIKCASVEDDENSGTSVSVKIL